MASAELSNQEVPVTPWWLILIEGVILILVGLLLLARTGMASVLLVQLLGIYWLTMGLFRIVSIFIDNSEWGWKLLAGVLGIIAGFLVLRHPLWSTAVVARSAIIILGITGLAIGLIGLYQAFKGAGWGTGILGVVSIILGIALLANVWVLSFSLPLSVGILSIVGGIAAIFGAFRARGEEKELATRPGPAIEAGPIEAAAKAPEAVAEAPAAPEAPEEMVAETPEVVAPAAAEPAVEETPQLDHHALAFVEGIGPAYAEKLAAAGVNSTESLLQRGATPKGRADIANESGISGKLILTWVNHADLMRIKGVGSQFADLLEEAGVDTIPDLARRNATNLYKKIVAVNEEKKLVRHLPSQADVEGWVAMAKELPRIIQY
jgi:uncharacterized membrane protein HdeD (DUF308 family)/predicted flap endonuclease-1-like 5' DNA nuclease